MTAFILTIVSHTPAWVWAVFAALVLLGLRQTRTQDMPAARVLVVPAILVPLSLLGTVRGFAHVNELVCAADWAAGAALGFFSNRVLDLPRQVSANADGTFRVGGSIVPLLLFVGIFMIRYVVNVALAVQPSLSGDVGAACIAGAAYGLTSGMLAARARKIWSTRRTGAALVAA